ncbi:hypothetical protein BSKO_11273 [Bryopsis sp. KO-2023]|nr:hypothetical protein BSKO_11273 [Bryopsis sp. KO-2023]
MQASGESRLQKLLNLLENGSNEATRKAAAKHISDIAKVHPAQLPSILRKVHRYLDSKKWECRVAAAEAVGLVAEHFVHHTASDLRRHIEPGNREPHNPTASMRLSQLNLKELLASGKTLLACRDQEYDMSDRTMVDQQRRQLREKLGAGVSALVSDGDLTCAPPSRAGSGVDLGTEPSEGARNLLSAREKNRLKRKARTEARTDLSKGIQPAVVVKREGDESVNVPTPPQIPSIPSADNTAEEDQKEWNNIIRGAWPFQRFCDLACIEVLDSCWEVRHGAALALREVLRSQAGAAGISVRLTEEPSGWLLPGRSGRRDLGNVQQEELSHAASANQSWLENCVVVLLCVLAMDRVGDFVSDQMVAPVRETAAQALGTALQTLPVSSVKLVLRLLHEMVEYSSWEVRHGGLLGLKYLLAARKDISAETLPLALPAIMRGLEDNYDDVRAAAAEVMEPVALELATEAPQVVEYIRKMLWEILLDMDDLSSATASVMQLLWQLYSQPGTFETGLELSHLVPRLWPFFRHSLTAVRLASVQCLEQLLTSTPQNAPWLERIALDALIFTFFNLLLESKEEVLVRCERVWDLILEKCSDKALAAAMQPHVIGVFFKLASTPSGRALDETLMGEMRSIVTDQGALDASGDNRPRKRPRGNDDVGVGSGEEHVVGSQWAGNATRMRLSVTHALGHLGERLERCGVLITGEVMQHLSSASATSRLAACLVVWYWIGVKQEREGVSSDEQSLWPVPQELISKSYELLSGLSAATPVASSMEPYSEVSLYYTKLRREWTALQNQCVAAGFQQIYMPGPSESLSVETICELTSQLPICTAFPALLGLQQQIFTTATTLTNLQENLHMAATASAAASVVRCGSLPGKLNGVIQPLMGAIRKEGECLLQNLLAEALAGLISICTRRKPSPTKMLKNICVMACGDPMEVPCLKLESSTPNDTSDSGLMSVLTVGGEVDPKNPAVISAHIARCGAEAVLVALAKKLKGRLFDDLPQLWDHMTASLDLSGESKDECGEGQDTNSEGAIQAVINCLQILKVVGAVVSEDILPRIAAILPSICECSKHVRPAVRLAAARAAAELAHAHTEVLMPPLLDIIAPSLGGGATDAAREGAAVLVFHLQESLGVKLVPYTILLIVPLLARMSDPVSSIRLVSTSCFGTLVGLLPLAQGMDPPRGLSPAQHEACVRDNRFLEQLLDNKKVDDYKPGIEIDATLRSYQQDGINWLAFLRRFGLHGVLADDMGLGKTLQAAVTIAASTIDSAKQHESTQKEEDTPLPSLVVCPATLVAHWIHEITRFLQDDTLKTLQYLGTPAERAALQTMMPGHNLVVTSYESLRADIEWLSSIRWNYCVLDEGHLIRNPTTRVSQACKQIVAKNRLILSGTPIQNNVLELWSLFDFLMPGFLGTRKDFMAKYGKAVQAARYSKKGSAEAEAGLLALGSLHKQVMPFVMRRTKEEVLSDLPPKIIQDIYCELSPLQQALYEDFSVSKAADDLSTAVMDARSSKSAPHVFQSIQYLRRVCGHPLLALRWDLPQHQQAVQRILGKEVTEWSVAKRALQDSCHAPKLQALKELLEQCGIRGSNLSGNGLEGEADDGCTPLHRMLVFGQLRELLDIVESDVLVPAGITFLRLDGSVDGRRRMSVVQKFNSDPTIGVMLLTTRVGGLGLNLTSADTVVFLEHDWNPMNDMQAMDRVHRLGQERTVNVYRILTKGTLEEKIMGLQQFKMTVANSVVNKDNMSMNTMDTSKVLDLFAYSPKGEGQKGSSSNEQGAGGGGTGCLKSVLEGMDDLWDEKQYEEEFSMDHFMKKLAGGGGE